MPLCFVGVRFGQHIPEEPLANAYHHAQKADLAIVLGSSCTVSTIPELAMLAPKSILCTLQETHYDNRFTVSLKSRCDRMMGDILAHLGLDIGTYTYTQQYLVEASLLGVENQSQGGKKGKVRVEITSPYPNEGCTCIESAVVSLRDGKELEMEESKTGYELEFSIPLDDESEKEEEVRPNGIRQKDEREKEKEEEERGKGEKEKENENNREPRSCWCSVTVRYRPEWGSIEPSMVVIEVPGLSEEDPIQRIDRVFVKEVPYE